MPPSLANREEHPRLSPSASGAVSTRSWHQGAHPGRVELFARAQDPLTYAVWRSEQAQQSLFHVVCLAFVRPSVIEDRTPVFAKDFLRNMLANLRQPSRHVL